MIKGFLWSTAFFAVLVVQSALGSTLTITPNTTLSAETANNTSAANTFTAQSNGNMGAGNVSRASLRTLMYPGFTGKIYTHLMPWFGSSSHMNIGYDSADPAEIARQIVDMQARGLDGVIVDWYGPFSTHSNLATINFLKGAELHSGFELGINYDHGAYKNCGCNITSRVISDLNYAFTTFESSPSYIRWQGRPLVTFFGVENDPIDWNLVRSSVQGNPVFVFRNSSGFTRTQSNGSFAWIGNSSNTEDEGLPYLDGFYATAISHLSEDGIASSHKGFNDTLASWGLHRIMDQKCGVTWLDSMAEIGKYYSASRPLGSIQLATWNDYEEGSELESGIDNCVSLAPSLSGSTLNWAVTGTERGVDHYTVFISLDGQNLMPLIQLPRGSRSLNLGSYALAPATYTLYVKATGVSFIANHMSPAIRYVVAGTAAPVAKIGVSPASGPAPFTTTASAGGSTGSGSLAYTINFGDGTSASTISASHLYSAAGAYTVTATVRDTTGRTASASTTVSVTGTTPAGVTLTSPVANGIYTTSLHVLATAGAPTGIHAMKVYVDGVARYSIQSNKVDTTLTMTVGSHRISVNAWDAANAVYKATHYITVH